MIEVSPSALNLFLKCPYAYYLSSVRRIPAKFKNQQIIDTGSAVHKIIQTYYEIYPPLHRIKDTLEEIRQLADKVYGLNDTMRAITDISLMNFISFEERRRSKLDIKPYSEYEIKVRGNNVIEKGIIDVFLKEPKVVVDFKTSNLHEVYDNYKLQLNFYRRLVEKKFDFTPKTYLYYLLSGDLVEVKADRKYDDIIEQGISKILVFLEEDYFPKCKDYCNNCPFAYYCKGND